MLHHWFINIRIQFNRYEMTPVLLFIREIMAYQKKKKNDTFLKV